MKKTLDDMKVYKNTSAADCAKLTEKSVKKEESLADLTSSEEDKKVFEEIIVVIKEKLLEILTIKTNQNDEELKKIDILKKEVCMLLLDLKKLNRVDKFRCRNIRDKVYESKQKVDVYHLQLQNLLYEAKFIQQEINKCLDFRSKIEDIELVDLDTFMKTAPKNVLSNEEIKTDQHKCTIERLKFELDERIKLKEEFKKKSEEKRLVISEVEEKQTSLENLKPLVAQIVQSSKPAYKLLSLETGEQQQLQQQQLQSLHSPIDADEKMEE